MQQGKIADAIGQWAAHAHLSPHLGMKKVIVLAVISTISQTIVVFAGRRFSRSHLGSSDPTNSISVRSEHVPQAPIQAKVPANCVPGVEVWIPLLVPFEICSGFRLQGTGARISGGR
jgi:hypothetical protein